MNRTTPSAIAAELEGQLKVWCGRNVRNLPCPSKAFQYDWLGSRSDGANLSNPANARPSATILFQIVREYAQTGCGKLQKFLELVLDSDELLVDNVLSFVRNHQHYESIEANIWAYVNLSKAAIAIVDGTDDSVPASGTNFYVHAMSAISDLFRFNGLQMNLQIPAIQSQGDQPLHPVDQFVTWIAKELLEPRQWDRYSPEILRALIQFESSMNWLLGRRKIVGQPSRAHVAFAGTEQHQETGSLACLEMTTISSMLAGHCSELPLLVNDFVYQGLMLISDDWHDAMRHAAGWASSVANESFGHNGALLYNLDFKFTQEIRPNRTVFGRPTRIYGPSASLSGAVLARGQLDGMQVDGNCCFIGAIGANRESQYEFVPVSGLFGKDAALDQCRFGGPVVMGKLAEEDKQKLEIWGLLNTKNSHQVVNPEQAYQIATGSVRTLRDYLRQERLHAWNVVGQFLPEWIHANLEVTSDDDQSDTADILDQVDYPQRLQRRTITRSVQNQRKPGDEPKSRVTTEGGTLNEIIERFLSEDFCREGQRCLKILGGPGMGKTWSGIRWHLKLLRRFFQSLTHGNKVDRVPFPIWTSFREVQQALARWPDAELIDVLCNILMARMENKANPVSDSLVQLLQSEFRSGNILLIVDSWDERIRDHSLELNAVNAIKIWQATNACWLTSRVLGESITSTDPLHKLHPCVPWRLISEHEEGQFQRFARGWFGQQYEAFRYEVSEISDNERLAEVTSTPQLAAICCALVEQGILPSEAIQNSAQLLRLSMLKTLEKHHSPDDAARLFDVLEELAFRTYNGQRWEFSQNGLAAEFEKRDYDVLMKGTSAEEMANVILRCGLFDRASENALDDKVQVLHQSFADLLIGSRLTKRLKHVTPEDPQAAHQFLLRNQLYDPSWNAAFVYAVELLHDATPLLMLTRCVLDEKVVETNRFQEKKESRLPCGADHVTFLIKAVLQFGKFADANEELRRWLQDTYEDSLLCDSDFNLMQFKCDEILRMFKNLLPQGLVAKANPDNELRETAYFAEPIILSQLFPIQITGTDFAAIVQRITNRPYIGDDEGEFLVALLNQLLKLVSFDDRKEYHDFTTTFQKIMDDKTLHHLWWMLDELPEETRQINSFLLAYNIMLWGFNDVTDRLNHCVGSWWANEFGRGLCLAISRARRLYHYGDRMPMSVILPWLRKACQALDQIVELDFDAEVSNLPKLAKSPKENALLLWAQAFWYDLETEPDNDGYKFWDAVVEAEEVVDEFFLTPDVQNRIKKRFDFLDEALAYVRDERWEKDILFGSYGGIARFDFHWSEKAIQRFKNENGESRIPQELVHDLLNVVPDLQIEPLVVFDVVLNSGMLILQEFHSATRHSQSKLVSQVRRILGRLPAFQRATIWRRLKKRDPQLSKLETELRRRTDLELVDNVGAILRYAKPKSPFDLANRILSTELLIWEVLNEHGSPFISWDFNLDYNRITNSDWFEHHGLSRIGNTIYRPENAVLAKEEQANSIEIRSENARNRPGMPRMIRWLKSKSSIMQFIGRRLQ